MQPLSFERAHPHNVRLYIRALRGQFPDCNFQRRLVKMMLKEVAAVEQSRNDRQPIKVKLLNRYAGHLKWINADSVMICKRGCSVLKFSYHHLENIIINNEFGLQ